MTPPLEPEGSPRPLAEGSPRPLPPSSLGDATGGPPDDGPGLALAPETVREVRPRVHTTPELISLMIPAVRGISLTMDMYQNRFQAVVHGKRWTQSYGPRSPDIATVLEDVVNRIWEKHGEPRPASSRLSAEDLDVILKTPLYSKRGL